MPEKPSAEAVVKCQEWRQGDFALGRGGYVFGDVPLTQEGEEGHEPIQANYDDEDPQGFVVVSQTCDIVRDEGLVAICPLERLEKPEHLPAIRSGRMPGFGLVEHAPDDLVADFSRIMCISKDLLGSWDRQPGFTDRGKAHLFARALERKLGRFAFPDTFNDSIDAFVSLVLEKFHKDGPFGKALRTLSELRVRPAPDWNAEAVAVEFFLISKDPEKSKWECTLEEAVKTFREAFGKITWNGAFTGADPLFRFGTYDDFSARDYMESYPLDLNALSFSARHADRIAAKASG